MKNVFLRVKLKSLGAESRFIRLEEIRQKKHKNPDRCRQLYLHRKNVVGKECRDTFLAYQYLRGIPYSRCESPHKDNHPNWYNVERMVEKYSDKKFDMNWITQDQEALA